MRVQFPLGVGGTLEYEPPEEDRPSAATVALYSPAGTALTAPAVTIDPVNTTLSASASAGATQVTLTSGTGVVARRRYAIIGADGEREFVRVKAIASSVVTLMEPLVHAHASGAVFAGNRLTAPVSTTDAATLDEGYEARWTYTIDSVVRRPIVRFDVVRTVWPRPLVSTAAFRRYAPALLSRELEGDGEDGLDFATALDQGHERVLRDIRNAARDPSRFRSPADFEAAVCEAALLHLATNGGAIPANWSSDPGGYVSLRRLEYDQVYNACLGVAKEYDEDEDGVTNDGEQDVKPKTRRWVR